MAAKKFRGTCSVCGEKVRCYVANPSIAVGHFGPDAFWCTGSNRKVKLEKQK